MIRLPVCYDCHVNPLFYSVEDENVTNCQRLPDRAQLQI